MFDSLQRVLAMLRARPDLIRSPRWTQIPNLTAEEQARLPYRPDAVPGGRQVDTPYGSINVYEWGPTDGEKVLFVHGISTPCIALADLAQILSQNGYRVMIFDLFGRGYSDMPDVPQDTRLFTTQILLVLTSSAGWFGGFHLVGYSLGGGIAASFARYFPQFLRSVTLVTPSGILRQKPGFRSQLLFSGLLPTFLQNWLIQGLLTPRVETTDETALSPSRNPAFDHGKDTVISMSQTTVFDITAWQVKNHRGYVQSFASSMRFAPIHHQHSEWSLIASRKQGLHRGKVHVILGTRDPVIPAAEVAVDAQEVLGDALELTLLDGSHELPIAQAAEVAGVLIRFWRS